MAFAKVRSIAAAKGFRSGLEDKNQEHLKTLQVPFEYEPFRIPWIGKPHTYTPDFVLANGIVVETKGYFLAEDRTKHLLIADQYPGLDLRFVFTNAKNKLRKGSKTTYGDWCDKHGFRFAEKLIPPSWVMEQDHLGSLRIIQSLRPMK